MAMADMPWRAKILSARLPIGAENFPFAFENRARMNPQLGDPGFSLE